MCMALLKKSRAAADKPLELEPEKVLPEIFEALAAEGYRPTRDSDIRIVYKNEGTYFCFYYRAEDPEFLMLRATFERSVYEDVHEAFIYKACAATDFDQKVSKAYVDDEGDLVFSVESFLLPGTPVAPLALRLNDALAATIAFFHRKLPELVKEYEREEEEAEELSHVSGLPN